MDSLQKTEFTESLHNSCGLLLIEDLIEFIEHAADMCADTADYILVLSSRE